MNLSALRDHLVNAAAATALIGGGATVVSTATKVAVHEERISKLEELNHNVEGLREDLGKTREELIRSTARENK